VSALLVQGTDLVEISISGSALELRESTIAFAELISTVETNHQAADAVESIRELRKLEKFVEYSRTQVKRPVLDLGAVIDLKAREFVAPVTEQVVRLNCLVDKFNRQKEAERQQAERSRILAIQQEQKKEQERLAAIALEQAKAQQRAKDAAALEKLLAAPDAAPLIDAEAQRLAFEAAAKADIERKAAEAAYRAATTAVIVATAPAIGAATPAGVSVRREPKFRVTDALALARNAPELVTITPKAREITAVLRIAGEFDGDREIHAGLIGWWEDRTVVR